MARRLPLLGAAVAVIVVIVVVLLLLRPGQRYTYLRVNAQYAFLMPEGDGQYELFYYDQNGTLHDLGTYNISSNSLGQVINVINSFNQKFAGTIINNQQFIPLDYIIVIGNTTKMVEIPVHGNVILLDKVNSGYWTVVVSDQSDLSKLAYALDVGYMVSAHVSGISNLWYTQPTGTILQETMNLQGFSWYPGFFGGDVIVMNNGTIVPWGFLGGTSQYTTGIYLPFIHQASVNGYS